jgi:hypothetical protein
VHRIIRRVAALHFLDALVQGHGLVGILSQQRRGQATRLVGNYLNMVHGRPRVRSAVLPAPLPTVRGSWRDHTLRA